MQSTTSQELNMKRHHRIQLSLALALSLFTASSIAIDTMDGVRTMRSADVHTDDYPTVQAVMFMNQQLQKASGGKLAIRVFPSALLGDEAPLIQAVQAGELDMNRVSIQAFDSIAPLTRVLSLPYLFRDTAHLHKVLDGPIGNEILDSLSSQGVIGLAFYDAGIRNIYSTKKPIQKLEDMKNLNVRVQPSEMSQMVFELLGARPVRLPFSQTARALSNDLVDAAENNLPSYSNTEHYKFAPFYSMTRHTMSPELLIMSKMTWEKLSSAEKSMVKKAARESVTMMRDMWAHREERVAASLKLADVKFYELPKEQIARFAQAVQPVYAKFAGTPKQQALIKKIQAVQ
jgi:tripartite ATP-independent transporter DctP family solute receptor